MSKRGAADAATGGSPESHMRRGLVLLFALATGLSVANTYYTQPLLDSIARSLHAGTAVTGLLITLSQFGYAAGLLFLVPLGDRLDRRRLVTLLLVASAVGLACAAAAVDIGMLAVAVTAVGLTSVVAQILVPFAATLAPPERRGQVVGVVMSGLLLGLLLSRTFAGFVADVAGGWRSVFWLSAALTLGLVVVLHRRLPHRPPTVGGSYASLLRSVGRMMLREPVLRRRSAYGALAFALVSMFWAPVAFLLARPPYQYGDGLIGLFGLVGLPAALLAPRVGRLADRGAGQALLGGYFAVTALGMALLLVGRQHLLALVAGGLLITIGTQAVHVTNLSAIYRLDVHSHSRVTTGYMTVFFFGGMAGSASAATAYAMYGWSAVPLIGGALAGVALVLWLLEYLRRAPSDEPKPGRPATRTAADPT